jgi:hypothetical protein
MRDCAAACLFGLHLVSRGGNLRGAVLPCPGTMCRALLRVCLCCRRSIVGHNDKSLVSWMSLLVEAVLARSAGSPVRKLSVSHRTRLCYVTARRRTAIGLRCCTLHCVTASVLWWHAGG